jgi:hypothetical protein
MATFVEEFVGDTRGKISRGLEKDGFKGSVTLLQFHLKEKQNFTYIQIWEAFGGL